MVVAQQLVKDQGGISSVSLGNVVREHLETLNPAYFGFVMSTGTAAYFAGVSLLRLHLISFRRRSSDKGVAA